MDFDLARLSEDDLVELNRRIVERLQLLRSAKSLAQVARFWCGRHPHRIRRPSRLDQRNRGAIESKDRDRRSCVRTLAGQPFAAANGGRAAGNGFGIPPSCRAAAPPGVARTST